MNLAKPKDLLVKRNEVHVPPAYFSVHICRYWFSIAAVWFYMLLSSDSFAQGTEKQKVISSPGLYNTFQWTSEQSLFLCPQVFGTIKKVFVEARFNYEYLNTGSFYVGYGFSFEHASRGKFSVTPFFGGFFGERNGVAPGYNCEYKVGNFVFASEGQFTFDTKDPYQNYFWNWANALYSVHKNIALGTSIQLSAYYRGDLIPQISPVLRFQHKWLGIDLYTYNFWEDVPIYAVGLEIAID
jgi:hypothetical protein